MQLKTLWDKIIGHMSIQSKFQLSRASKSKMVTWKPFSIIAAPQFTERLKQLCVKGYTFYLNMYYDIGSINMSMLYEILIDDKQLL